MDPKATEFGEIMQYKGHYDVQDHSRCTNRKLICDLVLVNNTNLPPILHCFQCYVRFLVKFSLATGGRFNALAEDDPLQISG